MKTALGRGLDALIPQQKGREIMEIELGRIAAGRSQPRKTFAEAALTELAASIKEHGVLQPVLLRREPDGSFSLIAGERRTRAARLAGLKKIPAIIRDEAEAKTLEIALIENIQREDLNPVETADAFALLIRQSNLTQDEVADKVGKDRATVSNFLRLLKLPEEVRRLVAEETLTMGHAKAILQLESAQAQMDAARKIVQAGMNVREAERFCKDGGPKARKARATAKRDIHAVAVEEQLIKALGTKVHLKHKGKRGTIEIEYYSLEELERLLDIMLGRE